MHAKEKEPMTAGISWRGEKMQKATKRAEKSELKAVKQQQYSIQWKNTKKKKKKKNQRHLMVQTILRRSASSHSYHFLFQLKSDIKPFSFHCVYSFSSTHPSLTHLLPISFFKSVQKKSSSSSFSSLYDFLSHWKSTHTHTHTTSTISLR